MLVVGCSLLSSTYVIKSCAFYNGSLPSYWARKVECANLILTLPKFFKSVGVDQNAVVASASIAELCIDVPNKYQELFENDSSQLKLSVFATQCGTSIQENPKVAEKFKIYKVIGQLLPLK